MSDRKVVPLLALIALLSSCSPLSQRERQIIRKSGEVMYVTVLPEDSTVLRTPSLDLRSEELSSGEIQDLMSKMLSTVRSPQQDGVGIAAPQVGINRRLVFVQRFDKEGEPFEPYANIHITEYIGPLEGGGEGCLSVPPEYGQVKRYNGVIVKYINPLTMAACTDTVYGYTARIFQHECDHLDGFLYIDKADSTFCNHEWAAQRQGFDYSKPDWWK